MAFTKNPSVSNAKIPIHYLIFIMTMSCEVQSSNQSNLPSPKLPRSGNFLSELKFYFPGKNSQQRACLSPFVGPITILIVSGLTTKHKTFWIYYFGNRPNSTGEGFLPCVKFEPFPWQMNCGSFGAKPLLPWQLVLQQATTNDRSICFGPEVIFPLVDWKLLLKFNPLTRI